MSGDAPGPGPEPTPRDVSAARRRFAEVVRAEPVDLGLACLLIGQEVDPGLDPAEGLAALDALAGRVDRTLPPAEALRLALAGFTGDAADYADLRSSLLHEVLRRRAGLPILLSVVWLEVAARAGISAAGIGLPGHFVVRVDEGPGASGGTGRASGSGGIGRASGSGETYVDPFSGGASVSVAGRPEAQLRAWAPAEILLRILNNIRNWAGGASDRIRVRLWAVELSLLLPSHPSALRPERAGLLAALGDYMEAAAELERYADALAGVDPDAAERARLQARGVLARLN